MFLESQYEDFIEDIHTSFVDASNICEDVVSDLDTLAWEYDELLVQVEDGEEYDETRVEGLVERFQHKIERGAENATNCGSDIDYYDVHSAIEDAVKEELRRAGYGEFADLI